MQKLLSLVILLLSVPRVFSFIEVCSFSDGLKPKHLEYAVDYIKKNCIGTKCNIDFTISDRFSVCKVVRLQSFSCKDKLYLHNSMIRAIENLDNEQSFGVSAKNGCTLFISKKIVNCVGGVPSISAVKDVGGEYESL
ncbi:hypothetical protein BB559_005528 [Furculomyces boomerangus]|uniref:Uncharacterized protein n=2 Tax=Harpellales TaxID=61421 RepID=A0A2T9Y8B3_9FUNG|nr:hypothetical protein BB559_005528 [Furculomyces boomerangus]PWA01645.1 hypothetical protein BB558_002245 [Smittium angustum]